MKHISHTSAQTYRACPRAYEFRYVLGYRPVVVSEALTFGKLMHRGIEHIFQTGFYAPRLNEVIWSTDADDVDRVKAEELLMGYCERWKDEPLHIFEVETPFRIPLINPATGAASRTFELIGVIDAIVQHISFWQMEHKTSSEDISPGSQYWQKLRIDPQISTYMLGAKALGYDVVGCIYDVIGKPRIKPYKATPPESRKYKKDGSLYASQRTDDEPLEEFADRLRNDISDNPERYYQRGEVVRLTDEEAEAQFDLWHTARMIRESELARRWPRNTGGCFKYNRPCDYWPVCTGETNLENKQRYRQEDNNGTSSSEKGIPAPTDAF